MNTERVETNTIVIEKLKYAFFKALAAEEIDATADFSLHADWFADSITARVKGFIWSSKIDTVHIQYPKDWWQAFKERWYPAWLKRKYPVVYRKRKIDFYAMYPEYKHKTEDPRLGKIVYKMTDSNWYLEDCK